MQLSFSDSEANLQLQGLASRMLIEIGRIIDIDLNQRATIELYNTNRDILKGVDIVYPGGFGFGTPLMDCLVFVPRTCYHPDDGVESGASFFSVGGAKALPISMGEEDRAAFYTDHCQNLSLATDALSLLIGGSGLSFTQDNSSISIDDTGTLFISLQDGKIIMTISETCQRVTYFSSLKIPYYQKEYNWNIDEPTIVEYWAGLTEVTEEQLLDMSLYTDWTKTNTYNSDGTTTEVINEETFITSQYTNNMVNVSINGEDNSISVATEKCTINIDTDGNVSLKTEGAITLETGNGTLGAMISELVEDINAIVTVGSPATHTIDPSSQQTLSDFVDSWGEYFT